MIHVLYLRCLYFFFFKQKTAYERRISDWSSDVCSSDLTDPCGICADPRRDDRALCVVEDVADLWALERSRLFPGKFHVLGGRLSALEGVRPEDLTIERKSVV